MLKISHKTVKRLGLPVIRVGTSRGVIRYREEDIQKYLRERLEYPITEVDHEEEKGMEKVRKVHHHQARKVSVPILISRKELQEIRVQNAARGRRGKR